MGEEVLGELDDGGRTVPEKRRKKGRVVPGERAQGRLDTKILKERGFGEGDAMESIGKKA